MLRTGKPICPSCQSKGSRAPLVPHALKLLDNHRIERYWICKKCRTVYIYTEEID